MKLIKVNELDRNCWVNINECLLEELKLRLGTDNVKVV
jgi:hypothetical protein